MAYNIEPIIDRRTEFEGKPGTHALIVGVSEYSHLPDTTGTPSPTPAAMDLGLRKLSSPALTAYRLYNWLEKWQDKLKTPLVTCRLLLSPSPIEIANESSMSDLTRSYPATRDNIENAAIGWREDAESHNENVTIFYFAGHGILQITETTSSKDPILLMEDFGSDKYKAFKQAVDSQNLIDGMKDVLARTQMYFFDCCRTFQKEFSTIRSQVPALWDVNLVGKDSRLAPVFYAAVPGNVASGIKGAKSYFGEALLNCLEGGAGEIRELEEFDGEERWIISIDSLSDKLKKHVNDLNKRKYRNQEIEIDRTRNRDVDKIICILDGPPPVDVVFKVDPPEACQYVVKIEIFNDNNEEVIGSEPPIPLKPHPYPGTLDAGFYTINAKIESSQRNFQDYRGKSRPIMPPFYERILKVKK